MNNKCPGYIHNGCGMYNNKNSNVIIIEKYTKTTRQKVLKCSECNNRINENKCRLSEEDRIQQEYKNNNTIKDCINSLNPRYATQNQQVYR